MDLGYFIAFEGPDGSGKSLQATRLREALATAGRQVVLTREPGGTALGEEIRGVLLRGTGVTMSSAAEALLYAASRAEHVAEVIQPALERGAVVLCDRFYDSSLAYQGGGRGLPMAELRAVQRLAIGDCEPDLKILLDLPVEAGLARRQQGGGVNRMDAQTLGFYRQVRASYLDLAAEDSGRWLVLDATLAPDDLAATIIGVVRERAPQLFAGMGAATS